MIATSLDHLNTIAKEVADNLSFEDCIFLIGEIGVGKTTFTRSLMKGLELK